MADTSRPDAGEHHPVVPATPARQGRYGRHVFWVLVVSTALAAIGLFLAWGWKAPSLSRPGSQTAATPGAAATFHAPEPAPQIPPRGTDHTSPGAPTPQTP
jgi:hypothetical protein